MLSKWDMMVYVKFESTDKENVRLVLSVSSKCSVSFFVILFSQVSNQSPAVPTGAGATVPPAG